MKQCRRNNCQRKNETKHITQIINLNKIRNDLIVKQDFKNVFLKRKTVMKNVYVLSGLSMLHSNSLVFNDILFVITYLI